jgi:chromosome segregation ATPase
MERMATCLDVLSYAVGLKHVLDWEGRYRQLEATQAHLNTAYKKDLGEWEERCAELVAEIETLKKAKPPVGRNASPKSDAAIKKLEQEVAALTTRLAEKEVHARRSEDALQTAKTCLNVQREKARSLQTERDTLLEQTDWLKKQSGILLKSNEVFVSHFLYSAAQALPDFKPVITRMANDKTTKETIFLYMKSVTTRGVVSLLDRVTEMVKFIEEHRADLLLPNEEFVKTYFAESPDGRWLEFFGHWRFLVIVYFVRGSLIALSQPPPRREDPSPPR